MRVVSAFLLAHLGGNTSPGASDIKKICKAGGVNVEDNNVEKFLKEVEGKSLDELLSAGRAKLASMPAAGAAPAGGGGGAAAGGAAADAGGKPEEKKVEEESEEEDMGFDLFD